MQVRAFLSVRALPRLGAVVLAVSAATALAQPARDMPLPQDDTARAAALQHRQEQRDAERHSIEQQRRALVERQKPLEAACYQKFAVEDCLRQLRSQAREQEKPLRERELKLNDAERREKSQERLRSIEQKMNEPRTPPPIRATPRQPLSQPGQPPKRTPADVANDRAAIDAQALQRAQVQAQHAQSLQQRQRERADNQAERRAAAQQAAQQRQDDAAKAKARRDKAVAERKGAPLPIPGQP